MAIENEELMQKLVRTGMVMRHIDGDDACCRKHGPHGKGHCGHGHGHSHEHGHGCGHGHEHGHAQGDSDVQESRLEMGHAPEQSHGPHGHGSEGRPSGGSECHGHGRGHGHGHGCGHGHGKRRGQARVLTMVSMQEGINQKDLAFLLGIRPQTLGEMLQKLEERGLVERKKAESDGRAIEVTLTDEGRARAAEIAEHRRLAATDMFASLTDEEKEQLSAILDKLDAEMEKHRPAHHGRVQ